jgi:hypothetical protein
MATAALAAALLMAPVAANAQPRPGAPLFHFRDGFWLNLHHFLYVLGRASAGFSDSQRRAVVEAPQEVARAALSDEDRRVWEAAVAFYQRRHSKLDAIFDAPLVRLTRALADLGADAPTPRAGLDAETVSALTSAAPIYRRVWRPGHERANARTAEALEALLDRHGDAVMQRITRAYGIRWPAGGVPIEMSGYANWAGAYSTQDALLVLASMDEGNSGLHGLEALFHEALHQWDDEVQRRIQDEAARIDAQPPGDLSHALIFHTAGEAMREVVGGDYKTYAEVNGIWQRRLGVFKEALDRRWRPHLRGEGTFEQAIASVLAGLRR